MEDKEQFWFPREEQPECLLIVDDSELNRAVLANIFEKDYKILEAENGREGLKIIEQNAHTICAVLLDVVMPQMDGIQALKVMKECRWLEQIPVFLITAENSDAVMREAYELGVMDVINKPVVPYVVQRRVNSVIELFRARRRLGAQVQQQQDRLLARPSNWYR